MELLGALGGGGLPARHSPHGSANQIAGAPWSFVRRCWSGWLRSAATRTVFASFLP
jgi:hypothetical protein